VAHAPLWRSVGSYGKSVEHADRAVLAAIAALGAVINSAVIGG
jgi:hypothetical protein